jgi:hypothetical protein
MPEFTYPKNIKLFIKKNLFTHFFVTMNNIAMNSGGHASQCPGGVISLDNRIIHRAGHTVC